MAMKVKPTITRGTQKGQEREFTQPVKCVIGRSGNFGVQLGATLVFLRVSRRYCVPDIDEPSLQVRDLGSGT